MDKSKLIIPALLGTLLIICASSIPDISIVASNNSLDRTLSNLAHIPAFALLAFLWFRAFPKTQNNKTELLLIVGLILFAISDEVHQSMIPGRTAAISDIVLDLIGIFLGFAAYKVFDRINRINRM